MNNILPLNKMLYQWKIVDSPRCDFCFLNIETIEHIFFECFHSRNFYYKICLWLGSADIQMPDFTFQNMIYGILPVTLDNALINTILLLFKFTIYKYKGEEIEKLFVILKNKLKECKLVEYKIALRNHDKLAKCDKKWNKVKILL